ncbi:hypothetical protein PG985_014375 [Apiospora marii]|uniref:uncharacterized protein n=1 Tax=Apiospora marii TaxID=335849 RepID=UPI00312D80E7
MAVAVGIALNGQAGPSETLCQSTPRFSIWGDLKPDSVIQFFNPKLEYNVDSISSDQGADKDPERVVDKPDQHNRGVYMYQVGAPKGGGVHARDEVAAESE